MNQLALPAAALFFFLHLLCETIATFIKYNFSSLGRHMLGISLANIFGISSRGFVALYGIIISIVIEKNISSIQVYVYVYFAVLLLGAGFSLVLANIKITDSFIGGISHNELPLLKQLKMAFGTNNSKCAIPVRGITAILLGIQFVSVVIAYGLCFSLPHSRLLIISFVPLVSMLGTLIAILWVEPRLARMIDADNATGYAAAREFLRARAISFFFCAVSLLALPLLTPEIGA